jgi:hypothetical protein
MGRGGRPTGSRNLNSRFEHREVRRGEAERQKIPVTTNKTGKISTEREDLFPLDEVL